MPVEPISALAVAASVLSITASIKQLMEGQNLGFSDALDRFTRSANEKDLELLGQQGVEETIHGLTLTIISSRLLEQLSDEADACEKRHIRERKRSKTNLDRENANNRAAQCMCRVLLDIRSHNGGVLPTGPFENYWDQYRCEL